MKKYIAYYRVSTNKQKKSGLGIGVQRDTVEQFVTLSGGLLIGSYEDTESGKSNTRPELIEAIKQCELTKATLVIAKLDRLSRNVAFLAQLLESDIDFVCCDNPHATKLTVHILAAMAEEERRLISERTKLALAKAKENGVKLGTNNLPPATPETALRARKANTKQSLAYNRKILAALEDCDQLTLRGKAGYLNKKGIETRYGNTWSATSVNRLYQ